MRNGKWENYQQLNNQHQQGFGSQARTWKKKPNTRKWKHSWPSETMKMDCSKGERFSVRYSIFIAFGHISTEIMTQLNCLVPSFYFHDPTTMSTRAAGQYSVIDTVNFCVEMIARERSIRWHLDNWIRDPRPNSFDIYLPIGGWTSSSVEQ